MQKTVTIDGQQINLVSSGATPIFYKREFGRDFFADLGAILDMAMIAEKQENDADKMHAILEYFKAGEVLKLYDFLWIYAKNANVNIAPQEQWLAGFDNVPVFDFFGELVELLSASMSTEKS